MSTQTVKIALIGFGTVGSGVARILLEQGDRIYAKTNVRLELAHVVDVDIQSPRPVTLPEGMLHNDLQRVLADEETAIAVELIGGTTVAADVVKALLAAGKHVVTANKALLAERGAEIYKAARSHGRCVAFEASCCGGIPLITALRTGLAANQVTAMYGIVNGTCNYILSGMSSQGKEYATALAEAQAAGFAEADPTLDVNGADSGHKLAVLAALAFGNEIKFDDIALAGIDDVDLADIHYGAELGYAMKLLAIAEQTKNGLSLRVHPSFISQDEPLARVSGPFNAVSIFGDAVGHTSYYGRGAGMMPTASAVVADIIETALGNSERLFASAPVFGRPAPSASLCPPEEIISRFYLRLSVVDQSGVLANIAQILGEKNISLSAVLQHEAHNSNSVPVVIMTHPARKGDMDQSLEAIGRLKAITAKPICIHVVTPPVDEQ